MDADSVVEAVLAASAPETPREARERANAFIVSFQDTPGAAGMAPLLLSHTAEPVRLFGLTLLNATISYSWASIDQQQQSQLKDMSIALISGELLEATTPALKRKAVSVAADIAVYEWPHNWEGLTQFIYSLATESGEAEAMERAVLAFGALGETIGLLSGLNANLDRITTSRAKQLNNSFGLQVPDLYQFAVSVLEAQLGGASAGDQAAAACVVAALDLFRVMFQYYSVEPLSSEIGEQVVAFLVSGLSSPFRTDVLRALQALLLRNHVTGEGGVLRLFDGLRELFAALVASNEAISEATISAEHDFQVQFVDVLVSLGLFALRAARRLGSSTKAELNAMPSSFGLYIQNCVEVALTHPSLRVQAALMPLWISFLREPLLEPEAMSSLLTALLELATNLLTLSNPLLGEAPNATIATLDFDSEDEVKKEVRRIRRRGQALMRAITRLDGPLAIDYTAQFIQYVFEGVLPESGHNDGANCSNDHPAWIALNGAGLMLGSVLSAISQHYLRPLVAATGGAETEARLLAVMSESQVRSYHADSASEAQARNSVVDTLEGLLLGVLAFSSTSPHIAGRHLALLEAFAPYLSIHTSSVSAVFEHCLQFLTFRLPAEESVSLDELSGTTTQLRDRAVHALVALAIDAGKPLLHHLSSLWEVTSRMREAGLLRRAELIGLYRAVLFILSKSADGELQTRVINSILDPILTEWSSDELGEVMGSGAALASALGLDGSLSEAYGSGVAPFGTSAALTIRERIHFLLAVMKAVAMLSTNWQVSALAPYHQVILGPLFSVISALNEFYTPNVAGQLPEAYGELLTILEDAHADDSNESKLGSLSLLESPKEQLVIMKWWLVNTHQEALSLLACLMRSSSFFEVPGVGEALLSTVFSNIDNIPVAVLCTLISDVMATLRRKAPDELKPDILFPVIKPFIEFVQSRLDTAWVALASDSGRESAEDAKAEIQMENELRKATLAFASFLRGLSFRLATVGSTEVDAPLEAQFLASNLASEFASAALNLLKWPLPASMIIGFLLCERMVPMFSADGEFCQFLASELLPAMLHSATLVEDETHIRKVVDAIHLVYCTLGEKMDDMDPLRSVFLQLNGLEAAIASGQLTLRGQATMWRKLLSQILSSNITSALHKKGGFLVDANVMSKFRATALMLGWNEIVSLDDVDFSSLVLLSALYLNHNAIVTFPLSVFTVRRLKKLYLNNNNLAYLPAELELLESLEVLSVSGNKLVALPPLAGLVNLQALYASSNHLMSVPESIGFCTELRELALEDNRLQQLPFRALLRLSQLHDIYLRGNPDLVSLPPALLHHPTMTVFRRHLRTRVRARNQDPCDSSTEMWVFKKVASLIVRARTHRPGSAMSTYTDMSDLSETSTRTAVGRKRTLVELRHSIRKARHRPSTGGGGDDTASVLSGRRNSQISLWGDEGTSLGDLSLYMEDASMLRRDSSRGRDSADRRSASRGRSRRGSVDSVDSVTALMRVNTVVESHQYEMMEDMRRLMDNAMRENEKLAARVQEQLTLLEAERAERAAEHQFLQSKLHDVEMHGMALQRGLERLRAQVAAAHSHTSESDDDDSAAVSSVASSSAPKRTTMVRFASKVDMHILPDPAGYKSRTPSATNLHAPAEPARVSVESDDDDDDDDDVIPYLGTFANVKVI
ncbi:uncharacterized protein AMSG_12163 [Thecamonas trahens ATCC 50062]|uniref:Exportin-5 C-terminal domain-containing protein n=1 Tax=Thecamonas trahens ATCC 50062 TaxID=461836 RepID=A0A0L0DJP5_THETB|nr:hypothetical protein AMSG_12163 [Thecamonas trahens ATCC 50062]KNC52425.1 hypothetical protein AMSG_12163 [Thecamonas trahens ATCC 50062]|eukprot:XP_013755503.1 hypothetical protein AMSG_12163 [Thecamonas trahens ATCC 50062]